MTEGGDAVGPRAMVLAAGYGTRLRPLTEHLPKPLLPVLGRPLLDLILERLEAAGFTEAGVNTHHLAAEIARFAQRREGSPRTTLFPEAAILGTGGALANAREFLAAGERFLVHNGDVYTDADLGLLLREHAGSGALATLLLVDWPQVNTVLLAGDGTVAAIGPGPAPPGGRRLTYSGVAVFERAFLELLPGGPSSMVDALRRAMAERPGSVRGAAPARVYWNDVGTMRRYLDLHRRILGGDRSFAGLDRGSGSVLAAPGAYLDHRASCRGFVWVGTGARVEAECAVTDCVILPGVRVAPGEHERAVVGPGWEVTQAENERLRLVKAAGHVLADRWEAEHITDHGSDRLFRRVREDDASAVLMTVPAEDAEFERYLEIGRFLWEERFGGPRILAADPERRFVLLEDLGDHSLYAEAVAGPASRDAARRRGAYLAVLDRLVDLQVRGTEAARAGRCPLGWDRVFDRATLRWETDYFRRRFLHDFAGVPEDAHPELDADFERLAGLALEQPVVLMHRDFQSQNIFFCEGRVRLVDFQGMRRGPLLYDLMSLLRDAYVDLGPELRNDLLEIYGDRLAAEGGPGLPERTLGEMAVVAGLQRNMQALGAFGYLSLVKDKPRFRDHVPLALRHLGEGLDDAARSGVGPFPAVAAAVEEAIRRLRPKG